MLLNYKNLALWGTLIAFNTYGMESKFNFAGLPLDMQNVIATEILQDKQLTPKQLYVKLLNFRAIVGDEDFVKFIQILQNTNIANKKCILSRALVCAVKGNSFEIAKTLLSLGANAKVWDLQTKRPIVDWAKNQQSFFSKLLGNKKSKIKELLLKNGAIENVHHKWNADYGITALRLLLTVDI